MQSPQSEVAFDNAFASIVTRRGLLPALVTGRPSRNEKHLLKQARRDAARMTRKEDRWS